MQHGFFHYVWHHSRREQIFVLFLVVASLPFYWASLDVPKQIVNDAIQGRAFRDGVTEAKLFAFTLHLPEFLGIGPWHISDGLLLEQVPYLMALSFLFLALTLINGGFKYVINVEKGVLGERMLRRLRFELFALVMRFRPEDIRATKSAEVASMIKDEVEPIGGFFGEAFITPAFLGLQAMTALIFIMAQNLMMGVLAGAVILVQGVIIPKLRAEQLRLGRQRQIASRKLAGRVAEMVDNAPMLHGHGVVGVAGAEIGDRLGHLFRIRLALFKRKFSVKFLNNLLAQVTPFIFYTLGGWLALQGQLDIGQLVAVIAAYRDLPGPIKELIDWDQQRADVIVKFEQVVGAFSRELRPQSHECDAMPPEPTDPILVSALSVSDSRNVVQLERISLVIERPGHVALVGPQGSARDILPKVIGGQITPTSGAISFGAKPAERLTDEAMSRAVIYVGGDPHIMPGTIRDNLCLPTRRRPPNPLGDDPADAGARALRGEAERTGNPIHSADDDWVDYEAIGATGPDDMDKVLIGALRTVCGYDRIFRAGMEGRVGPDIDPETAARFIAARTSIRETLAARALSNLVEPFDHRLYNNSATIGENLLFGIAVGQRFAPANIASEPFLRSILLAEALSEPLVRIGRQIAQTLVDVFSNLPPGSPLFERYSFFDAGEREQVAQLLADAARRGKAGLKQKQRQRFLGFALNYIETRHRLNLLDEALKARILRARISFRMFIAARMASEIEFYERDQVMQAAPIRDNLLFGRVGYGATNASARIDALISDAIREHGLELFVVRQGLAREAGPGGRLLSPEQRAMIALARAVLVRPQTLVLDNALGAFAPDDQAAILAGIRRDFADHSLLVTLPDAAAAEGFDRVLTFNGTRLVADVAGKSGQASDTEFTEDPIAATG